MKIRTTLSILVSGLCFVATTVQAGLIHRYSFSETPGATTVKDGVGSADGVLKGTGADFDGTGNLMLPGGTTSDADPIAGYVNLPNHIINVLTNLTVEAWVTCNGTDPWQRVFDFGTSNGGEDVSDGNGSYIFLSPLGPDNIRFAFRESVTGTEPVQDTAAAPLEPGTEVCLTVTYDRARNISRVYSNAVLIASGPASLPLSGIDDVNNWLGRSQWGPDTMFNGLFNEFRIYDSSLDGTQVGASYLTGPDALASDISLLGAVQAVHLGLQTQTMLDGDTQTAAPTANFASLSGVPLVGAPGVVLKSDDVTVLTVSTNGDVTAIRAGSARLTVTYQGFTDSVLVLVNRRTPGVAVAGTLYVDLQAADVAADQSVWTNRAGFGDFTVSGTPGYETNTAGTGVPGVVFLGTEAYAGPATTTNLDGSHPRSIEVWAMNPGIGAEETMVAWGHRGGPNDSNMAFNYGNNTAFGAVGHWADDLGWKNLPTSGRLHYLVYTYDGATKIRVYSDGVLANQKSVAVQKTYAGFPIRLGAQGTTDGSDFDLGQTFSGTICSVRVHSGRLTDVDITNNFFYGAEFTSPGALKGIALDLTNTIPISGDIESFVRAQFENRSYLLVNNFSTFTSSDTNILSVDATGLVRALNIGTAKITATYLDKQTNVTVQVVAPPKAVLVHRYSFNETVGSLTVKDSVGSADGTLKGSGGAFNGTGKLSLPGGAATGDPATEPAYVDLPNGILSSLTNVTLEAWVTWRGGGVWQRIWEFGSNDTDEDLQGIGQTYFSMIPTANSGFLRFSVTTNGNGAETILENTKGLGLNVATHVAVTYSGTEQVARLYVNGVRIRRIASVIPLSAINDVNAWLGKSVWADPFFNGQFDEFRMYNSAMTDAEIAAEYTAGPDALPVTKPRLGIQVTANGLFLVWPGDATGYAPESSSTLVPQANWGPVPGTPDSSSGNFVLKVENPIAPQFYRLKKP